MIVFPNAKINIGLHVLDKRKDGYHNIETVFYPIPLCDVLEVIPAPNVDKDLYSFSGKTIPGSTADNLCLKALEIIRQRYDVPMVSMHLHKVIPMGAGLGGGSSDAAHFSMLINELFDLGMEKEELKELLLQVGSDCPFFVENLPSLATGRGEALMPIDLSLKTPYVVVVVPNVHLSTAQAYEKVRKRGVKEKNVLFQQLSNLPFSDWQGQIVNDFEQPTLEEYSIVGTIKKRLVGCGALYASMSGSGSAVFGLFEQVPERLSFEKDMFVWSGKLVK